MKVNISTYCNNCNMQYVHQYCLTLNQSRYCNIYGDESSIWKLCVKVKVKVKATNDVDVDVVHFFFAS